jgi:serine/threonine protein kinase
MLRGEAIVKAGERLAGRYEVRDLLGEGGMGQVWRAVDLRLDRMVAVKTLSARLPAAELREVLPRFQREGKAAARLSHPSIATIFDAGEHEGHLFIVLEFVRGEDLRRVLARSPGGLPVDQVLDIGAQVADGLVVAHEAGVIHRDVKPANVMLLSRGGVKLCDFGIARLEGATSGLSVTGAVMGTVAYMSPEQMLGQKASGSADVYSLAATLFHLITGRVMFRGDVLGAIIAQNITAPPPDPRALRRDCPAGFAAYLLTMLAKEPGRRPSAAHVAGTLRALGAAPATLTAAPWQQARRGQHLPDARIGPGSNGIQPHLPGAPLTVGAGPAAPAVTVSVPRAQAAPPSQPSPKPSTTATVASTLPPGVTPADIELVREVIAARLRTSSDRLALSELGTMISVVAPTVAATKYAGTRRLSDFVARYLPEYRHVEVPSGGSYLALPESAAPAAVKKVPLVPSAATPQALPARQLTPSAKPASPPKAQAAQPGASALKTTLSRDDVQKVRARLLAELVGGRVTLKAAGDAARKAVPGLYLNGTWGGEKSFRQFLHKYMDDFRVQSVSGTDMLLAPAPVPASAPAAKPLQLKPTAAAGGAATAGKDQPTAGTGTPAPARRPAGPPTPAEDAADIERVRAALVEELGKKEVLTFADVGALMQSLAPRLRRNGTWAGEPTLLRFFEVHLREFRIDGPSYKRYIRLPAQPPRGWLKRLVTPLRP